MSTNQNALSGQWSNYLDLQRDLKPWMQLPLGAGPHDHALAGILDMACEWVQDTLSRPIAPTSFVRRFNGAAGWTGSYITLPYSPVLEVVKVTEYRGTSGAYVLPESTPTNQVDGWQCEYLRGTLTRVFAGNVPKPWFPGARNIEVSWVAGFNPIPAYVRIATLEYAKYWWANTQQSARLSPRDYDAPDSHGLWPGVPSRITDLLSPLMQVNMG